MEIEIKKMETDGEIAGKAYVHWKSWQEAYKGLVDASYLEALTLEKCTAAAFEYPGNTLVAKVGENVVGFCAYGEGRVEDLPGAGEIYALYVLPEYCGTGIGMALMDAGLEKLEGKRAFVRVLKNNARAIRFYEKCGFVRDGFGQELVIGTPVTVIRMVRG